MPAEWYKEQPKNRNFLAPTGFKFKLELFDSVDFFCQAVNFPDISMPITPIATGLRSVPVIPGGGVEYGDLNVQFILDEDLINYHSIWKWIQQNGNAEGFKVAKSKYSHGQLHILTSNYNTQFIVDYERLFPVALTDIIFDATVNDIEYFTASATFKFTRYTLRDKNFKIIE
tara:strand:- start:11031 stop:11546 length:516 start_codon:yes stop_codon:yes gene_type:complete